MIHLESWQFFLSLNPKSFSELSRELYLKWAKDDEEEIKALHSENASWQRIRERLRAEKDYDRMFAVEEVIWVNQKEIERLMRRVADERENANRFGKL